MKIGIEHQPWWFWWYVAGTLFIWLGLSGMVSTFGSAILIATAAYLIMPISVPISKYTKRLHEQKQMLRRYVEAEGLKDETASLFKVFAQTKDDIIRIPVGRVAVEAKLIRERYYDAFGIEVLTWEAGGHTDKVDYTNSTHLSILLSCSGKIKEIDASSSRELEEFARNYGYAIIGERKTERGEKRQAKVELQRLQQDSATTRNDRKRRQKKGSLYIIRAGENLTAIKKFEEFLSSKISGGDILLCDSYISYETLLPFTVLKGTAIKSIRILTNRIVRDSDKFLAYKKKMEKEMRVPVEIRTNSKVHDRYLISGKECWSVGTSINELGNKDTVLQVNRDSKSMNSLFQERWKEGTPL
jgi:hypothetical protein